MKIPEEFIGCGVRVNNTNRKDNGVILGRIASWYVKGNDVFLVLITNEGTFKKLDSDYAMIVKEDMSKVRSGLVVEKSDRFEILDL
mgnify:CR=1 FL=1|jgi:hypothetical protein